MKMKAALLAAILIGSISFSSGAASRLEAHLYAGPAVMMTENLFKDGDEASRRFLLARSMEETGVSASEEAKERLARLYETFASSGALSRDYLCYVTGGEDTNGFMRAGGVIGITKGAMERFSDDEAAFLLAHELAHGELGHEEKKLSRLISTDEALAVYMAKSGSEARRLAAGLLTRYETDRDCTDKQEKEADRLAVLLMMKAGCNPGGALTAVSKLIALHDDERQDEEKRFDALRSYMESLTDNAILLSKGRVSVHGVDALFAGEKESEASERELMAFGALTQIVYMNMSREVSYGDGGLYAGPVYIAEAGENGYMEAARLRVALMRGE